MTPEDERDQPLRDRHRQFWEDMERGRQRRQQLWEEARSVDRLCFIARVTFWALVLAVSGWLLFR